MKKEGGVNQTNTVSDDKNWRTRVKNEKYSAD